MLSREKKRPEKSPSYGRGTYEVDAPELEFDLANVLAGRIRERFASPNYQPPALPPVAAKLLALSREPGVEFRQVGVLLEQDALLAGKVLARAQSAMYAGPGASPIRTLHEALVRLGLAAVRNLVLELAMQMTIFRVPAYEKPLELLRRHSLATAYAARLVARRTSIDAEYVFLCGLLHDVGIGAALVLLGAESAATRPTIHQAIPALGAIHEELSGQVATLWKLPPEVQLVVGQHHRIRSGGVSHPAIAALRIAEGLAQEIGAGLMGPELADGLVIDQCTEAESRQASAILRIEEPQRRLLLEELKQLAPQVLG